MVKLPGITNCLRLGGKPFLRQVITQGITFGGYGVACTFL